MKKKITIDARMLYSSGIGTYIFNVLSGLIETMPEISFEVLLSSADINSLRGAKLLGYSNVKAIEIIANIYTISEQFELYYKVRNTNLFWSPHYNVPLFLSKNIKRLVTIHGVLLIGVAGSILAFLRFNWMPSKIFMGDTGSLFLGFLITISLIRFIEGRHLLADTFSFQNPISFSIAIIVIPFFDTIRVFSVRIFSGKSPFDPDKNHLHHLLLKLGFNNEKFEMAKEVSQKLNEAYVYFKNKYEK